MSVFVSVMALTTANTDPDQCKSQFKNSVSKKVFFIYALIERLYYYVPILAVICEILTFPSC